MTPQALPPWTRPLTVLAVFALAAGTVMAATGCSSSSSAPAAQSSASLQQDCTQVSDVLADGPDPDSDSVGYAQAQILQLQTLKLSDPAVRSAAAKLDAAYKAFSSATGSAQTTDAITVSSAEQAMNTLCPGVAP